MLARGGLGHVIGNALGMIRDEAKYGAYEGDEISPLKPLLENLQTIFFSILFLRAETHV